VAQPRRDVMSLPSKKRSAYRRKLQRIEAIEAVVYDWLETQPAGACRHAPAASGLVPA